MKTSELILKLNSINKTVPFDADIVLGDDDYEYDNLISVKHIPPNTHLIFDTKPIDIEDDGLSAIEELALRADHTRHIKAIIENGPQSKAEILALLDVMSERLEEMVKHVSRS